MSKTVQDKEVSVEKLEKLQRQINRYKKEDKKQKNRITNLTKRLKDEKGKTGQVEKIIENLQRGQEYYQQENKELEKEVTTLTEKLNKYIEEEERKKEKGIHVESLQEEITKLNQELLDRENEHQKQVDNLKRRIKGMRRNLVGEQRANAKRIRKLKNAEQLNQDLSAKRNSLGREVGELRKKLQLEKNKYIKLKREMNKEEREEIEETEPLYEGEELGYLIVEDQTYFVPLSGKKPRIIEQDGNTYLNGIVCKAHFYVGEKAKIVRTYRAKRRNEQEVLSASERIRLRKVRNSLSRQEKLGTGFFNLIHDKNILIVTSKQLKSYKMLFNRYENIEVIDPYGMGETQLQTKIDRSDLVVVRTDGAPHSVTNYVKDNKGDDYLLLYNVTDTETAAAITRKIAEVGG